MTIVTTCKRCGVSAVGIIRQCPECGGEDLTSETRGVMGVPVDTAVVLRQAECVCGRCQIRPFESSGVVELVRCAPVAIAAANREMKGLLR